MNKSQEFKKMYNKYFNRVFIYVASFSHDKEVAKNIVQDTFLKVWINFDKIDLDREILPYVLRIAKNETLNHIRHEAVNTRYNNYINSKNALFPHLFLDNSNLDRVMGNELEQIIYDSIEDMKPIIRDTFLLSRHDCLTNQEIADKLGISIKTVEYRIMIALRILQDALNDYL
jgi:RNA polymerase sigma-70 factor, ECF subfamily